MRTLVHPSPKLPFLPASGCLAKWSISADGSVELMTGAMDGDGGARV